jgi:hypothetical protein
MPSPTSGAAAAVSPPRLIVFRLVCSATLFDGVTAVKLMRG